MTILYGLSCNTCEDIDERDDAPESGDKCPTCGSDFTEAVRVEDCPLANIHGGMTCEDDSHRYGRNQHEIPL